MLCSILPSFTPCRCLFSESIQLSLYVQEGQHPALLLENLIKMYPPLLLLLLQPFYLCTSVISPSRLTGNEPLSILPLNSLPEENVGRAHYKLCDRLKLEKKQRRMCRRDPGVAETLREAVTMSALECQYQFRFERWNCTLEGRHRANILKRGMAVSSIYDPRFTRRQPATTLLLYACNMF